MGLDTTHDCWHGAYSAFMRWRTEIARVAGLPPLGFMEGFFKRGNYTDPLMSLAKEYPNAAEDFYGSLPIKWGCLKPSALHELLYHSGCDGRITWGRCGKIADALEVLIPRLADEDAGGHIGNWRAKTQQFVDGLRRAAQAKENVKFH